MQRSVKLQDAFVDERVVPEMSDSFAMKTVYVLRDDVADVAGVL